MFTQKKKRKRFLMKAINILKVNQWNIMKKNKMMKILIIKKCYMMLWKRVKKRRKNYLS